MISLDEARARVLSQCPRLHPRAVPLADALGCVTSVPLSADEAVPPFANTAMDGFAVRAEDTVGADGAPVELEVTGVLRAGADPAAFAAGAGQAVQIMTGAPLPPGADAVVMVERTEPGATAGRVRILEPARPGDHIRGAGDDLPAGSEVFPAFTILGPGHLGVLASLGLRRVPVFPRPRVGVLSTGDELVDGPGELRPGQIRDSNRPTLLALCRESGFDAVDLGVAPDDEAAIEAAVRAGIDGCDALLTSGGVSMGEFDFVKAVLDRLGAGGPGMAWMQVAIRPAKPLAFGVIDGTPVFGLPGNPVSSMVSFELFARPALRQMMGFPAGALDRPRVRAVATEALSRRPDGKTHFARVAASMGDDGRYRVRLSGGQASHLLRAMALANALAVLPDGDGVPAGGEVEAMLLGEVP